MLLHTWNCRNCTFTNQCTSPKCEVCQTNEPIVRDPIPSFTDKLINDTSFNNEP